MSEELSLLALYAHPDDEQLITGVLAQCASEGIRTGLLCATRGEAGQIHESAHANEETIGQVREAELRAAAVVVGVKDLWFLDYRDSGWFGSPDNSSPSVFANSDEKIALEKIVKIIREFRPTILLTFDAKGGYGHLDHLKIHKLANDAFSAAADPAAFPEAGAPWQVSRLFYATIRRSFLAEMRSNLSQISPDDNFAQLDLSDFGAEDSEITNVIDVSRWIDLKDKSLQCHRTQYADYERWQHLPPEVLTELRATEYYVLGMGVPLPDTAEAKGDLFAGLR